MRKRILYIITKSVWGGAGKYVFDLATNLPKDKFDVIVAAGGKNELAQKLKEVGISYYEIKSFRRDVSFFKDIFAYFEILFLLFKIKPDIVHVSSSKAGGIAGVAVSDYEFLTLKFLKSGKKIKTIFTAHGWAFHEARPSWQIFLIKLFTKISCFYYSKIICVSELDRVSAINHRIAPDKKLITIRNGINEKEYNFLEKDEAKRKLKECGEETAQKPKEEFWIGTIGEFTKNKGQKYLIEAIQKLRVTDYALRVTLIGWGEENSNLKSQIQNLGLEKEVFLLEIPTNAANYLKAFDIFVLPSLKEGLPYTLLEAGLVELPVIATNVGGIPEIIQDKKDGLLAEPADSNQLAEKIEELINDPEKRKLFSANLWQKALRDFSINRMLNATIALYEQKN